MVSNRKKRVAMLENLRRKSIVKVYNNQAHQINFDIGHAKYQSFSAIEKHRIRLETNFSQDKSFPSTLDEISVGLFVDLNLVMIPCPIGNFKKGHIESKKYPLEDERIGTPFLLGETEITQDLYQRVMGINPSGFKDNTQNPVERVSWYDAILFCNELSKLQGLRECYYLNKVSKNKRWNETHERIESAIVHWDERANGYRLPLAKEWEYAAKAGTNNRWSGTDIPTKIGEYAWYSKNSDGKPHAVKTRKPNEWGFYDMTGNVMEWCWDIHAEGKVLCGNDWNGYDWNSYVVERVGFVENGYSNNIGFRVARSLVN